MTSDEAEKLAAQDAYNEFLEEAQRDPIKFIKHDNRAHDDDALYRLVNKRGMAYYGWYWLLVELLAGRKGHYYDVSSELGWRRLARDMSCLCDISIEDCKFLIKDLYDYGLIVREQYDELHRVAIGRLLRDALTYAEDVAGKRLGAWKTNRKKLLS
jgi:hypothetical protein